MDVTDVSQPLDGGEEKAFFFFKCFTGAGAQGFVVDKVLCADADRQREAAVQLAEDHAGVAIEQFDIVRGQGVDGMDVFIFQVTGEYVEHANLCQ